jgi:hypothetical protein
MRTKQGLDASGPPAEIHDLSDSQKRVHSFLALPAMAKVAGLKKRTTGLR